MFSSYISRVSYCRYTLKALANEDTLLPTQMFLRLPARATFFADTNFVSGTQKMFLISFRNICVRNKCFPVCAARKYNIHFVSRAFARPRNIMSNNVSATMCSRLPGPLAINVLANENTFFADTLLLMMFLGLRKLGNICCASTFVCFTKHFMGLTTLFSGYSKLFLERL